VTYYAAFVPGMQDIIAALLRERLADVVILKLMDGAVIFKTECTYDGLNFLCFNNIFALIDILEQKSSPKILEQHIKKILRFGQSREARNLLEKIWPLMAANSKQIKSFRLVCSVENKPIAINENLKMDMESFIMNNSGLKLSRSKPDTEFWFIWRREGFSCFMKRLTNHRQGLHPGELSPQLAWLLCHIADLKHGEIVIDPFCGYGSIPQAACKHFPIKKILASDIDPRCIKITGSKSGLLKECCEILEADFHSIMNYIPSAQADAIVTDPPWGMYKETPLPLQTLYNEILEVFSRVLKNKGRAVILSAAEKELETAVEKNQAFSIKGKIPILVSGKKAFVFVLAKGP
jgi:predicted RNA methylase